MNSVNIVGRFTKELELKTSASGNAYLHATVAVDRRGSKDVTDFVPVSIFGKTAEFAAKNLSKGSLVAISGSFQSNPYTKDGVNRTSYAIAVNDLKALTYGKKNDATVATDEPVADEAFESIEDGVVDIENLF